MEIRDVKTICAKGDLCTALRNQHFYVRKIYVRETNQAISDCFIHFEAHKLVSFPPDHLIFCGSDSEMIIWSRESFLMAYTGNEVLIPVHEFVFNP